MPKVRNTSTRTGPRYLLPKDAEPTREGKWYPAEDVPKPRKRQFTPGVAKLRKSITPGTVLILLAGRFRGRRVVFLKQLASGLLLVTGPFAVNGVPLRRVNQAYVIATSTVVDVKAVSVPEAVSDEFFRAAKEKAVKGEADFLALKAAPAAPASEEHKRVQGVVDAGVKLSAEFKAYLKAKFALSKGDLPHAMKF